MSLARSSRALVATASLGALAVVLTLVGAPSTFISPAHAQSHSGGGHLSNGCAVDARGVPDACGAYFGGVTGANADPSDIEKAAGQQYGVRRTYWRHDQVDSAVRTAEADVAKSRLPWISFKLPKSWKAMANGEGDAWVKNVADRLDALDGPVWVAFHHMPEGDSQSMADWKRMQEHLAPLVRSRTDNVGFTAILMGWPNLYGKSEHRLENIWPETKVDVAGFGVYNAQGKPQGDGVRTRKVDFENDYYKKFDAWAKANDTAWAQAETGYTDYTADRDPRWIRDNYALLRKHDGVAFSYFNSHYGSGANWQLNRSNKMADFQAALKTSPTLTSGSQQSGSQQSEPEPEPEPQPEPQPAQQTSGNRLTNGCAHDDRGVPNGCGAYFGGVTGSNDDPSDIEQEAGQNFGVRRTFWRADQVDSAVRVAKRDVAKSRLPWMSFKLPKSWRAMARGEGDAWVKDLVDQLDDLDGPVWVAFHHEPEDDSGDMQDWKRMQEHLGPLVRSRTDSVGFTAILMGWPNLYGKSEHRLDKVWPDTKVDVAGFDVYNAQGVKRDGERRTKPVDFENDYYKKFDSWAKANNTAWGQSETGYTDYTAERDPQWIRENYKLLQKYDGVAFSYFNTHYHSQANWELDRRDKMNDFQEALKTSPTLR